MKNEKQPWEKVLEEIGWDDKTFEEKLEILFGKKGMYKINGEWFAYPKIKTEISLAYFNALRVQIEEALKLCQKLTEERLEKKIKEALKTVFGEEE